MESLKDLEMSATSPAWNTLPPEVWTLIGDQIRGPKDLFALVNVCRNFHNIFGPILYASRSLELSKYTPSQLHQKVMPDTLKYTKSLFIYLSEFRNAKPYKPKMNPRYAAFVVGLIKKTPNLQSFRWLDDSFEEDPLPTTRMLTKFGIPEALKSCTSLRNLCIEFDSHDCPTSEPCFFPLKGFQNLSSLELYDFQDPKDGLLPQLVEVLAQSPRLTTLGLSMSCECNHEGFPAILYVDERHNNFLERLCNEYSAKKGVKPLGLQTLRLGHGMYMFPADINSDEDDPDSELEWCPDNFLAGLVKLDTLRNLHLYNGDTLHPDEYEGEERHLDIEWSFFDDCSSLRQLQITRLGWDVAEWLDDHGRNIEELIVTEHYSMYDEELCVLDELDLPKLTMLFTREMTVPRRGRDVATILDRLEDSGERLTRLGFCIELETEWDQFAIQLRGLNLRQLRMDSKSHRPGSWPPKESSLWGAIKKPAEIAFNYAKLIKTLCPSLQHIKVDRWAWECLDPSYPIGDGSPPDELNSHVRLREMEHEEFMTIELFAMSTFTYQAGLLGPLHPPGEAISDVVEEKLDMMTRDIERMIREQGFVDPNGFTDPSMNGVMPPMPPMPPMPARLFPPGPLPPSIIAAGVLSTGFMPSGLMDDAFDLE